MTHPDTQPLHVLVLCTGNSARSILAEGLLNVLGQGRIRAFSAGSRPTGQVQPMAAALVRELVYAGELRSQSWDAFAGTDAPVMDLILTVCDAAAGESCPVWPGHPVTAHWGVPDPAAVQGDDATRRQAYADAFARLRARVKRLLALPLERLAHNQLRAHARAIGHIA